MAKNLTEPKKINEPYTIKCPSKEYKMKKKM